MIDQQDKFAMIVRDVAQDAAMSIVGLPLNNSLRASLEIAISSIFYEEGLREAFAYPPSPSMNAYPIPVCEM